MGGFQSTGGFHRQGFPTIFYLSPESAEIQKVQATWPNGEARLGWPLDGQTSVGTGTNQMPTVGGVSDTIKFLTTIKCWMRLDDPEKFPKILRGVKW